MPRLGPLPVPNRVFVSAHWRKLLPAFAIGAAISAGIVALLALSEGDDAPVVQQGTAASQLDGSPSPSHESGVGGGGKWVWPPKRVTEGDWEPPSASVTRISATSTEEWPTPMPQRVGEVINGVLIIDPSGPEPAGGGCSGLVRRTDLPFPLEATYLPPNTFLMIEPEVLACADGGEMAGASVHYQIGAPGALASIGIVYGVSGTPWVRGAGEIQPVEIKGLQGVTVAPITFGGVEVGSGYVVLKTPHGGLTIGGFGMPLAELIKIAGGVKCLAC